MLEGMSWAREAKAVRYLQFVAGVMTSFFLPAPVNSATGRTRLLDSLDTFAWSTIIVLVLAGALLATGAPRASMRLYALGGAIGVIFGVGTLNAILLGSGLWISFLAALAFIGQHNWAGLRNRFQRSAPVSA
jgi:hypothetical protein